MKIKEVYIDMPVASRKDKRVWTYFNKPGQHCNKNDVYSEKWKPKSYSFKSGPGKSSIVQDHGDLMWEKIKIECHNSIEADCSKPNNFECKKRRHYQCPSPDPHFPADVEDRELVNHLKEFHPDDYTDFLRSVKLSLRVTNKNSKKKLKLSHGMIKKDEQVIIRFPLSRSNPVRHDDEEDDDDSLLTIIKTAYKINPVGAYAGNYARPIGSQGSTTDLRFLPDKFENFVSYRHNTSQSCHIFDVNENKWKALNGLEKIDSYIIKEEVIAPTIVGPVTDINTERVVYTCQKNGCQFPCLCHICVQQIQECNVHKFKHPALFDKKEDHLLLRTPHNFDINNFTGNTSRKCYAKNGRYLGYDEPVEQTYLYAGIKILCTSCNDDLYYHSVYHFVYHDKCKFCRFSSYQFEGISTLKEYCEQVEDRVLDERRSCHICYKIFSSEKTMKNHIQIVHENKGDYLCDECGRIFGSQIALEYHLSNHHENGQWMCKLCLKSFNLKHSHNVHVKNVHGMKTFECKICSKSFKRLSNLVRHKKYVHGVYRSFFILDESPDILYYYCDLCSFKTRYTKNLRKHIETIHTDVKFSCNECGFISNRQDNLERHINTIHSDVKYKCCECEFVSNRNDNFTDTVHGDEKKFFCTECDFASKTKDKMKRHMETKHTEEFKHSCNECDYQSKRNDNLKRHVETVHANTKHSKTNEDLDEKSASTEMKSSLIEVDEEDTVNQTWAKSKWLDTNVNLDKTWLPDMKDEDLE